MLYPLSYEGGICAHDVATIPAKRPKPMWCAVLWTARIEVGAWSPDPYSAEAAKGSDSCATRFLRSGLFEKTS
jgi:hypothetical protein